MSSRANESVVTETRQQKQWLTCLLLTDQLEVHFVRVLHGCQLQLITLRPRVTRRHWTSTAWGPHVHISACWLPPAARSLAPSLSFIARPMSYWNCLLLSLDHWRLLFRPPLRSPSRSRHGHHSRLQRSTVGARRHRHTLYRTHSCREEINKSIDTRIAKLHLYCI